MIKTFRDLEAWRQAHLLLLKIYKQTKNFPYHERSNLIPQLRRAATSITSNIAEGFSRSTRKDKQQFYRMAQGSLTEIHSQIILARDLDYISIENFSQIEDEINIVGKLLTGIIRSAPSYHIPTTKY